jgi:hypothetical protein
VIGIVSQDTEVAAVHEFFQLFKTPWEFCVLDHDYDLVIATSGEIPNELSAKAIAIYSSVQIGLDQVLGISAQRREGVKWLQWSGVTFPVYGGVSVFQPCGQPFIQPKGERGAVGLHLADSARQIFRIGYDLFQEVSFLLSTGQPAENSHILTLEMHIALLRDCMVNANIPFVEIAPVPTGYDFMACLTHDVDFVGIRDHKCDHTMWGFVYRGLVGSLLNALAGRMAWSKYLHNVKAVFSLPLVYLGLRDDFWLEFDRYMQIEKSLGSTFFLLPFKNVPGTWESRPAPKRRAAKYDFTEIKDQVLELIRNGCEVGLHGIDAWQNSQTALVEMGRIREVTKHSEVGARMHWLYFAESSPKALEDAGCAYDSTFGYNDAIGFRAGTTQVFCPVGAHNLLELALNIQDTAMFYPRRLNLSEAQALESCKQLIQSTVLHGGVLTVNWHTRSLSPERLWGDFYAKLLKEIQTHRVWFGTAGQIVKWFRKRRNCRIDSVEFSENNVYLKLRGPLPDGQPSIVLRIHHPRFTSCTTRPAHMPAYMDIPWRGEHELNIAF